MTRRATITVTNLDSHRRTNRAAIDDPPDGVAFTTSGDAFTLAPGDSKALEVTVTSTRDVADGHYQGTLRLSSDGTRVAHARLFTLVGEGDAAPGRHTIRPPAG